MNFLETFAIFSNKYEAKVGHKNHRSNTLTFPSGKQAYFTDWQKISEIIVDDLRTIPSYESDAREYIRLQLENFRIMRRALYTKTEDGSAESVLQKVIDALNERGLRLEILDKFHKTR